MSAFPVRSMHRAAVLIGLLAGLAGCSGSPATDMIKPSALPESLAARGGGPPPPIVRYYAATLTPGSVTAGSLVSFTAEIINCPGTECGSFATNNSNQLIRSGAITIPAGYTGVSISNISGTGGKTWSATVVAGTIRFGATQGNQGIIPGERVTIHFNATAPSTCGSATWDTEAYQDTLSSTGELQTGTPYTRAGDDPIVYVTGCSTGCTFSQGHWKTHGDEWPVSSLTLGTVSYTKAELLSILNAPVVGNGLISLAHQLIAAKLNIASGASNSAIAGSITAADALIGGLVIPPVGGGTLAPAATSALVQALDDYNNGVTGPGHCPGGN